MQGLGSSDLDASVSNGPASGRRVSAACARCRQQKLKVGLTGILHHNGMTDHPSQCDSTKPCIMCVRSGVECRPRQVKTRARTNTNGASKRVSLHSPRPRRQASTTSTSPVEMEPLPAESVHPAAPPVHQTGAGGSPKTEQQQFGANRSTISLAMNMYESLGTRAPTKTSTIPGDASRPMSPSGPTWTLQSMPMPDPSVMETLIDVYFERLDWFIWIFHKPSFIRQAQHVLTASSWRRRDMRKVLVTLTVAALGLKSALQDTSPYGQQRLASISDDPRAMIDRMIGEVRIHLIDLLDDSCIETVQVCQLLGAYYIFHGSPSLAWAMIGLAVRASYALALHCASESNDQIDNQVRRRCWNHLTVADAFASQIYGRPASLDAAFSDLLPLTEIDDTEISIYSEPYIQDRAGDSKVTALTFHWLKYKLYNITRTTLSKFRLLRLHNPMTVEELEHLIEAVKGIDVQLANWRNSLPSLLNAEDLSDDFPEETSPQSESFQGYEGLEHDLRRVKLQACLLQVTHDAAVILAHRPLLEHRLSSAYRQDVSKRFTKSVSRSFDTSIKAALRISRVPIMQFKNEFCLAFIFVHLFTAGVILCIPPTSHPNSNTAHEAKAGAFRIIQAAKALSQHSQIARHTERLLSDLLKLSLHREVDLAFKEAQSTQVPTDSGAWPSEQSHHRIAHNDGEPSYGDTSMSVLPPPGFDRVGPPEDDNETFEDEWGSYPMSNLLDADGCQIEPLDLPLDEAFGQFGQGTLSFLIPLFLLCPQQSC